MNHLVLTAQLLERGPVRYTPAGLPALDLSLKHQSELSHSGKPRKVSLEMRALAVGEVTRIVVALPLGSTACFSGFMASTRNGRGLLFHITQLTEMAAPASLPARPQAAPQD